MNDAVGARETPIIIVNDVTLTANYVDSTVVRTANNSMLTLYVDYEQGASESLNTFIYQLKFSSDNTTWYTLSDDPVSTGAATVDKVTYTYTADTLPASGHDYLRILVPICDQYFKISFKEGNIAANYGAVTIIAQLGVGGTL